MIARLVDESRFNEFKARYGTTMVCVFARLHGFDVGILANNGTRARSALRSTHCDAAHAGVLFSEASLKAAQFIQLCNQKNTPLLFLQNITGHASLAQSGVRLFTDDAMTQLHGWPRVRRGWHRQSGRQVDQRRQQQRGRESRLLSCASLVVQVPAITITLGASYGCAVCVCAFVCSHRCLPLHKGAGNYAMCGRSYHPRFLFSWPQARVSVMGPDQVACLSLLAVAHSEYVCMLFLRAAVWRARLGDA